MSRLSLRSFVLQLATIPIVALALAGTAGAQVFNPPAAPINIIAFTQRDMVLATGYDATDRVVVKVIHPSGVIVGTDPATPIVPQPDPGAGLGAPFAGIVQVNHPGGACWFGATPDIRGGDAVRIDVVAGLHAGRSDITIVNNITGSQVTSPAPGTIVMHGTATDVFGAALPLADIEGRIIAPRDAFDLNGRRTLRAGITADGILFYDAPGSTHWTARFTGLTDADVARALGGISAALWNGAAVPAVQGTTWETGPGIGAGPSVGCNAPLEVLPPPPGSELVPPSIPGALAGAVSNFNTVTLTWAASTDNVGVTEYGIYRDGTALSSVQNKDGSAPAPTGYTDLNVPPGVHFYTIDAADAVGNRSAQSAFVQLTTATNIPANFPVNEPPLPPVNIIAFPSRDFISTLGWADSDHVDLQVIRDGRLITQATGAVMIGGLIDVNHPGGYCWEGVTPELRAGDVIRTIAHNPNGSIRTVDQTHVASVTCFRPFIVQNDNPATLAGEGIVSISGTSIGADGKPIPLDQIEQRMIAKKDAFDINGRRTLRAALGRDGTLVYDVANNPLGINWTATYSGLDGDDVARIVGGTSVTSGLLFGGAEPRIHWLGSNPLLLAEATIYENSDLNPPGPSAGACFTTFEPADILAPTAPSALSALQSGANVSLSWLGSTDDWSVAHYRILRDGAPIANVAATTLSYLDTSVPPGPHSYQVVAYDHGTALAAGVVGQVGQIFAALGQPYGNASAPSNIAISNQADVSPPTVPINLVAVAAASSASLSWSASTDNAGVASYGVYRGGIKIADVIAPATTFNNTGLAAGTYVYTVDAADAAGNRSAQSASATAIIAPVLDTTPPTIPGGVAASNDPDIHGKNVRVSWTASTDNVGVTGYGVYRDAVKIADVNGATLAYVDLALPAKTYVFSVDAVDSRGNRSARSAGATRVVANEPPAAGHSLLGFPARDFISTVGYPAAEGPYFFTLIRNNVVIATSGVLNSDAGGTVEVNHPGGTCWLGVTPNMRTGDVIRVTNAAGIADQTTIMAMQAQRAIATGAGTVQVHGSAADVAGVQLPAGQVECRIVSNSDLFDVNGRRVLRAGGAGLDGTFAYDAVGSTKWTATFSGLSAADMMRVCGGVDALGVSFVPSESRGIWLGRAPLALLEQTLYENGPLVLGGPTAPQCAAAMELPVSAAAFAPASLAFPVTAVGSASAAQVVSFRNVGSAPMAIAAVYIAGLNPGDFAIIPNVAPAVLAVGASFTVNVSALPKAAGLRQASINLLCDAANTTDLTIPVSVTGSLVLAPGVPGAIDHAFVAGSAVSVAASLAGSSIPVSVSWAASTGTLTSYQLQMSSNGSSWLDATTQPGSATSATFQLALGTTTAPASYQFRVRALNGASASGWSTGSPISLTPIDESNAQFVSFGGTWTTLSAAGLYGGTLRSAATNRDKAQLPEKNAFTAKGAIAWLAVKGPDRGMASVSIDKGAAQTVDLYAPVRQLAAIGFAANGLASGLKHSVVVQVLGARNAASSGTNVDLDGFVILNGSNVTASLTALAAARPSDAPSPEPGDGEEQGQDESVRGRNLSQGAVTALAFSRITPNPSAASMTLAFATPRDGNVELVILDLQGRRVRSLQDGVLAAGEHTLTWNGRDDGGHVAGAGVYFATLRHEGRTLVKRLVRVQ